MEIIPGFCSCGNAVEGTTNKCASCNREVRKRAKEAIKKDGKKIYRIKPMAPKRSKEMGEYKKVKDRYLQEHPICECCDAAPSDQIHHKAGRTNRRLILVEFFLATCDPCHKEIEANPVWAKENGYSVDRIPKDLK